MKIKTPAFITLIIMIICGIGIFGFLQLHGRPVIPHHSLQGQISEPQSDRSASLSLGKALLLLAVGISGALSVRRKKKSKKISAQKKEPQTTSDDRNRAFVRLNKQYLTLQYKLTQNKFSGVNPPDGLQNEISDLERRVRLISRALE